MKNRLYIDQRPGNTLIERANLFGFGQHLSCGGKIAEFLFGKSKSTKLISLIN